MTKKSRDAEDIKNNDLTSTIDGLKFLTQIRVGNFSFFSSSLLVIFLNIAKRFFVSFKAHYSMSFPVPVQLSFIYP